MIEKPNINESFETWPLHITIVPWFEAKEPTTDLVTNLDTLLSEENAFEIVGGERVGFGPDRNIPVFLVNNAGAMLGLHNRLMNILDVAGVQVDDSTNLRNNYQPHITNRREDEHLTGVQLVVDSVDLVQAEDSWGKKIRKTIYRFEFKR